MYVYYLCSTIDPNETSDRSKALFKWLLEESIDKEVSIKALMPIGTKLAKFKES